MKDLWKISWCFVALLGCELINGGYSRRPTWNVPKVFQFGEFRVDSTQHTLGEDDLSNIKRWVEIPASLRSGLNPRRWILAFYFRLSGSLSGSRAYSRVGRRDPNGEVLVSTTVGPGEMLRMHQGGKPLYDDQIQAVGQGALDQWSRSCSRSSNKPGRLSPEQTAPKRAGTVY